VTNIATKDLPKRQGADVSVLPSRIGSEGPVFAPSQSPRLAHLPNADAAGTMTCDVACTICPAFNLLCCGAK